MKIIILLQAYELILKRSPHSNEWGLQLVNKPIFLRERLHLQGDPNRVRHPLSASLTSPCTAGSHPLEKQSSGLFFNSPFAKRFEAICGVTPHSVGRCRAATKGTGLLSLPHTPPEALPLDSAKGTQSLWNPIHWYKDFFDRLTRHEPSFFVIWREIISL